MSATVKKRAIPPVPTGDRLSQSFKENLEIIMGQRGTAVALLADDATLADVIAKLNELIEVLQ